jgi:hypothetical protein
LVSFDGINVTLPYDITLTKQVDSWFHFDQSPNKKGMHCIKGLLNLQDQNENDCCFAVYSKSHLHHEKFFIENNINCLDDWYKLTCKDIKWFESINCIPIKVIAPKGSLILWDSRTAHCSYAPTNNSIRYA